MSVRISRQRWSGPGGGSAAPPPVRHEDAHGDAHGVDVIPHDEHGHGGVYHQFEDIDQQNESYIVGMWTFLVTEIMFFGVLFVSYFIYRNLYPTAFHEAASTLNVALGAVNT